MKSYTSNIGQRLFNDLRLLCDYPFEQRCGAILQTVFPSITATPARSEMDCAGIDHCMFDENTDRLLFIFQCKGFSAQEFGSSQLAQCLHSIEMLARSAFTTEQYGLIVNRIVKGEQRKKIEAALQTLANDGKAKSVRLLDMEAFLEMVFQEAQAQLAKLLKSSVSAFQNQHRLRMDESVYVESVPFRFEENDVICNNPLKLVEERILKLVLTPTNKRSWTLISGEFGFGKTSMALHLAESLHKHGITCLYLPAAQFRKKAFENEGTFLWEALKVVLQEEVDQANERNQIFHAALKEILKRDKQIVFVFDGIDEHPVCWHENGLMNIFGIFKTFNTTCVFAVREEFLAERSGQFQAAIKRGPGAFTLRLIEWPESLILEYAKNYQRGLPPDAQNRISHFEEAVRTGHYVDYYGDIPKRPLFLKMLLDDVAKDDLRTRNLAELYSIYIAEKFEFDRSTSTSNPVVSRPLSLQEDYEFVCARLFDVMTMAAGQMYSIEAGEARLDPRLSEIKLRECAKTVSGDSLDLPSILLNSVMVPVGRRDKHYQGGYIDVAFAHTSFQEFFLAHHILASLLQKNSDTAILNATLPKPVTRFLTALISTLSSDDQSKIRTHPNFTCDKYAL